MIGWQTLTFRKHMRGSKLYNLHFINDIFLFLKRQLIYTCLNKKFKKLFYEKNEQMFYELKMKKKKKVQQIYVSHIEIPKKLNNFLIFSFL